MVTRTAAEGEYSAIIVCMHTLNATGRSNPACTTEKATNIQRMRCFCLLFILTNLLRNEIVNSGGINISASWMIFMVRAIGKNTARNPEFKRSFVPIRESIEKRTNTKVAKKNINFFNQFNNLL